MNDEQFEALDSRAKTAAESVQAEAQRRTRPAFDADRPMTLLEPAALGQARAPRRTAWIAAAAVVALVAGAVTFAVTRPDDGKDTIAATAVEDPRPFVADELPEGLEPMWFADLGGQRDSFDLDFFSPMPVYGKTTEEPLAAATVVNDEIFDAYELTSSKVDGMTLYRPSAEDYLPGQWVGVKQGEASILVFGATEDDAVSLARIVSAVDGGVSVDPAALPDGWRRLVTVDDPLSSMSMLAPLEMVSGMAMGASPTKGYMAAYMSERFPTADVATGVQIYSMAGDEPSMWAGRIFANDSRQVTVRGQQGYIDTHAFSFDNGDASGGKDVTMTTVGWVERPGEVIRVVGTNVTEDELLAVAEGLRPATEQEWTDLTDQTQLGGFDGNSGSATELGRTTGTFDDGTKWSLAVLQSEPYEDALEGTIDEGVVYTDLRLAVSGDGSSAYGSSTSGSSSVGSDDVFISVDTFDIGGRHLASGIIGDDVARVQLQRADGSVLADTTIVEVAGFRAFLTELTEDPTIAVALRADGSEVGRVIFENLDDNVTVGIDGDGVSSEGTYFDEQGTLVDRDGNPIPDATRPTETTELTDDHPPG